MDFRLDGLVAVGCPRTRCPAAEFLPYHLGRQDDWRLLDTLSSDQKET